MANVNNILPGYPVPWGNKWAVVFDHYGPSAYSNIASSSGTGDVINASDLGFGGIDYIAPQHTPTGTYTANMYTTNIGGAQSKVALKWFSAFATEVTNGTGLSSESVRLLAICV